MTATQRITSEQRYRKSRPCPICGGNDQAHPHCHGYLADGFAYCTREERAGGAILNEKCEPPAYVHKKEADGTYRPWTETKPTAPKFVPTDRQRRVPPAPPPAKTHATEPGTDRYFDYGANQRVRRLDVTNEHGQPDKDVKPQYRADGRWHVGDGPGEIEHIYRRAEAGALPDEPLHIAEGEPCCDQLRDLGYRAITWRGGCGRVNKATEQIVAICTGQHVVLHPDTDAPGRKAMHQIALAIKPVAASVKMLDLFPDEHPEGHGKDVQDFLTTNTADDLRTLINDAPTYDPPAAEPEMSAWDRLLAKRVDLAAAIEHGIEPQEYLVQPILIKGAVHGIVGGPEQGKTMLLLHLVLEALRAGKRVMMLDEEIGTRGTAERLEGMGATTAQLANLFYFPFGMSHSLEETATAILEGVQRAGIDLVTLDSISKGIAAVGMKESDNDDTTAYFKAWITPAAHLYGATVVYLDHITKADDSGDYGRGASSKKADSDVLWSIKAHIAPTRESMGRLVLTKKKDRLATVPANVTYIAGGDGTGRIKVGLEASEQVAIPQADEKLRDAITALHESGPMKPTDWARALGRLGQNGNPTGTFNRHRDGLVNVGHVTKLAGRFCVTASGRAAYFPDDEPPPDELEQNSATFRHSSATAESGGTINSPPTPPPPYRVAEVAEMAEGGDGRILRAPGVPNPAPINTPAAKDALERVCAAIAAVRRGKADGTRLVAGVLRHDARMAGYFDVAGETINDLIERVYGAVDFSATSAMADSVAERSRDDLPITNPNEYFGAVAGD